LEDRRRIILKVKISYNNIIKEFENKQKITIGNNINCDFVIKEIKTLNPLILMYVEKYNNYIVINPEENSEIKLNQKKFSKTFALENFSIDFPELISSINISCFMNSDLNENLNVNFENYSFDDLEKERIKIIKDTGYKIQELKNSISSMNIISSVLNTVMFILSFISSFAITNFLLGLNVDNSSSVLNLTTNFGFLVFITLIVFSISLILKHGVFSYFEYEKNRTKNIFTQKTIAYIASLFMFTIYIINLFYYKNIPGFSVAAFFISLLFSGGLTIVALACGYIKFQLKEYRTQLMKTEYRADFEGVIKNYIKHINKFVNSLSENKITNVRENLLNFQFKMIIETIVGILTAPFLAYGVSNTLASCFPEAASWVRISGIRFSPIFLVLSTFLIIFAFFSFVRAFAIGKQIKNSEIIKFDGFNDYIHHGVRILGIDAIRTLKNEKNVVLIIACSIILIEFTMNVSYFITEIGADIQGMFLSVVTAFVPTALLIAETHLLSSTINKINNYSELLSMLD